MKKLFLISGFLFCLLNGLMSCPTITISATNVTCFAGSNGTATAVITGSNGPFNCTWSTGQFNVVTAGNSTTAIGLPAGIYTIYVVDQLGCSSVNLVTVNQPAPVVGSATVTNVLCNGQSTGIIDLTPNGGTPPYTYAWSNGATSQDLINVAAGNYSVLLSDANGCGFVTINSIVTEPPQQVTSSIVTTNVNCLGGTDGEADLSVIGGVPPYAYNWNSGTFLSEDLINIPAGNYTVVVTDNNGCQDINTVVITEPTAIISNIAVTNVLCFGQSTGTVNLSLSGGTPPYSFAWSNSTFTLGSIEDLFLVPAETYTVLITDANGCNASNSATVTQPTEIQTNITSVNVTCFGYSNGSIDLFVLGGTPGYTYQWSNSVGTVGTTEDLINIPAETYNVLVTDNNGCTATNGVEITQPLSPLLLSHTVNNVLCFGDNSGSIDLSATGGTFPYTYSWSNGQNSQDVNNLFAGPYLVTVLDNNACSATASINVLQPAAPLTSTVSIINVLCNGNSNGSANLSPAGGTPPYTYTWINSTFSLSETAQDLVNYPADQYTVTITDNNGCVLIDSALITQPAALTLSLSPFQVMCFGDSTGSIQSTVTGGVTPYIYTWSNGNITPNIINLPAGLYSVNITDANNCVINGNVVITQPLQPLSSFHNVVTPGCNGSSDGEVDFNVLGGTLPYSYFWSTGVTLPDLFNITAGSYSCIVTDGNGCTLVELINVSQPAPILITGAVTPVNCFGESNGAINLTVTGGNPSYNYQWSNSSFILSDFSQDLSNYPADQYSVTVTDSMGCSNSASFIIPQPAILSGSLDVVQITCFGTSNGSMTVTALGGNGSYQYSWSNGATSSSIINLGPGSYSVLITDLKNCSLILTDSIIEPEKLIPAFTLSAVSCRDQSDGTIQMQPTGGYGGYTYLWSTGETTSSLSDLEGGDYMVTVFDMVGCAADTTITIEVTDIDCIEIPNAFTPEGDGYNDTWMIKNIELYENCVMRIYNNWGTIVFESKGIYSPWDGTAGGRPLPAATYYYIIKLTPDDEKGFTGAITIVR